MFDLAQMGDLLEIETRTAQLEKREAQFTPFARQLRRLARDLEDEQVVAFIERYLEEDV